MHPIYILLLSAFILYLPSSVKAEVRTNYQVNTVESNYLSSNPPVEKRKRKKRLKRRKRKLQKIKKQNEVYNLLESVIGITVWTFLIAGSILLFVGTLMLSASLIGLLGLVFLGFATALALISSICIFVFHYSLPDESMAQTIVNLVTLFLTLIIAIMLLIGGLINMIPLLWITGILLLVFLLLLIFSHGLLYI
jgi:hypothetical protein